jgi:hypothetical protein
MTTRRQQGPKVQFGSLVCITSSWPSSSSGTKPLPPQVGHRCSSSVPFSMTPSPLQSGQVFKCEPHSHGQTRGACSGTTTRGMPARTGSLQLRLFTTIYDVIPFGSDLKQGSHNLTRQTVISSLVIAIAIASSPLAHSQQMIAPKVPHPIELQQVAPDLYFLNDYDSSNAGFLVTDEGVLVIDTRQHPRDGQDLIDRIRKITDKPLPFR